jgi:hypothetical protein
MLDFQFEFPVTTIGFMWADLGDNVRLSVNGVELGNNTLPGFDGTTQGGANIDVAVYARGTILSGFVTITGTITQFSVGGTGLEIDDVRRVIPAPSALSILPIGALALTRRRR